MKFHFGNLSYMSCVKDCEPSKYAKKNHLHFNSHTLTLIDSLVKEKHLKDNLYRNVAMDYLLKVRDNEKNNKIFLDEFLKLSANNKHIDEIKHLFERIKRVQPNSEIPHVMVYTTEDDEVSLKTIASSNKEVVFYLWTGTRNRRFDTTTARVAFLKTKYPQYTFVGINYNTDPARWRSMIESKGLDPATQFRSDDTKGLVEALVIEYPNKSIITKDGRIADAFADIYASF